MVFPLADDNTDRASFPVVNSVLIALNVAVFAAQHMTVSGLQRLVPGQARDVARRAASDLRSVGSISLAMALEKRLHVLGEADRIVSEVEKEHSNAKLRVAKLRTQQAGGSAAYGLAKQSGMLKQPSGFIDKSSSSWCHCLPFLVPVTRLAA